MKSRRHKGARNRGRNSELIQMMVPLLLFLFSAALYFNTLSHEFVFDDVTLIQQNPQVIELDWLSIIWQGGYRPIRTLSYAVNYALGGDDPFGYHLFNLLLHAGNVVLLFILLLLLTGSRVVAGVAGLIYAVHPVQTAAVAYVSGRKDLLAGFFLLLGFILYVLYRGKLSKKGWVLLSYLAFLLAVLSKEVALVFPALLLLIDSRQEWEERGGLTLLQSLSGAVRRHPLQYLCFAVLGFLATYWVIFINEASRMEGYWGGTVWTNLGTSFKLFVHYLRLSIFPSPLIADYLGNVFPISKGFLEPATLAAVIIVIVYLAVAWKVFQRNPLLSIAMFWFLLLLLPVLHLVPFHEIAADHFEYLPMVGVSLAAGIGFSSLLRKLGMPVLLWTVLGFLLLGCVLLVTERNRDWKSSETLWAATYRDAPESYRANANLGELYFRQGLESNAEGVDKVNRGLELTRKSIQLDPSRSVSWSNLGAMYLTLGRQAREKGELERAENLQAQALEQFQKAQELESENSFATESNIANVHKELGNIYEAKGRKDEALTVRKRAVELYHHALQTNDRRLEVQIIWMNLGGVFIDAGYYAQATYYLGEFLKAYPDDPRGNYWMGFCLAETKKYEEAVPYLEKAVQARPTLDAWSKLALSYGNSGQLQKGIDGYVRILSAVPDSSEAHFQIGILYEKSGNRQKALEHLNRVLTLEPESKNSEQIRSMLEQGVGG